MRRWEFLNHTIVKTNSVNILSFNDAPHLIILIYTLSNAGLCSCFTTVNHAAHSACRVDMVFFSTEELDVQKSTNSLNLSHQHLILDRYWYYKKSASVRIFIVNASYIYIYIYIYMHIYIYVYARPIFLLYISMVDVVGWLQ